MREQQAAHLSVDAAHHTSETLVQKAAALYQQYGCVKMINLFNKNTLQTIRNQGEEAQNRYRYLWGRYLRRVKVLGKERAHEAGVAMNHPLYNTVDAYLLQDNCGEQDLTLIQTIVDSPINQLMQLLLQDKNLIVMQDCVRSSNVNRWRPHVPAKHWSMHQDCPALPGVTYALNLWMALTPYGNKRSSTLALYPKRLRESANPTFGLTDERLAELGVKEDDVWNTSGDVGDVYLFDIFTIHGSFFDCMMAEDRHSFEFRVGSARKLPDHYLRICSLPLENFMIQPAPRRNPLRDYYANRTRPLWFERRSAASS